MNHSKRIAKLIHYYVFDNYFRDCCDAFSTNSNINFIIDSHKSVISILYSDLNIDVCEFGCFVNVLQGKKKEGKFANAGIEAKRKNKLKQWADDCP